jgi:hypothetical protein
MALTKGKGPLNPFYPVLVLAGIVFCVTACAYGVMAYRGASATLSATQDEAGGLIGFLERRGGLLLGVELAILAAATAGAIALDEYRSRRAQSAELAERQAQGAPRQP